MLRSAYSWLARPLAPSERASWRHRHRRRLSEHRVALVECLESRTLLAGDIALLYADHDDRPDLAYATDVKAKLDATGLFDSVTKIAVHAATPTLEQLQSFDAVLVWSGEYPFADAAKLGTVLANYADSGGGGVVVAMNAHDTYQPPWTQQSFYLRGRWEAEGYAPLRGPNYTDYLPAALGAILDPDHLILQGVDSFHGGRSPHRVESAAAGATVVANWSDGRPLIVDLPSPTGIGNIVGLNFFAPSSDKAYLGWRSDTDGALIMANSLQYAAASSSSLIDDVVDVSPDPRNARVGEIDIVFARAIDPATFTSADLQLRRNGEANLIDAAVWIHQVAGRRYRVSGLDSLTWAQGNYQFRVNGSGINDAQGNSGAGYRVEGWVMDTTPPQVADVFDVVPDPHTESVSWVEIVFSEPIDPATFDFNDVTLRRDGGPNLINSSVWVGGVGVNENGRNFYIGGLRPLTSSGGDYVLTVDASGVRDLAGNAGTGTTDDYWRTISYSPVIANIGPAVTYREGDAPLQLLADTTTVSDPDSPNFADGSLIVSGTAGAHDRLTIRHAGSGPGQIGVNADNVGYEGAFLGTFSGGVGRDPLVVNLNRNATPEAAAALLKAVSFHNVNTSNLTPFPRAIRFTLNDGEGGSRVATQNITLLGVNDAPLLDGISGSVGYTVGASPILIASAARVLDPDSPNFAGGRLTVEITGGAEASNRLLIRGYFSVNDSNQVLHMGTVVGSVNNGGGVGTTKLSIAFNHNATSALVQQLIRQLRFRTVGSATTADRIVAFRVSDGDDGTSETQTRTIVVG